MQGISTRSVDDLVKAMGMSGISKSQVSRLCEEIDVKVKAFLDRPIEGDWPYIWIDATYLKVRRGGRIVSDRHRGCHRQEHSRRHCRTSHVHRRDYSHEIPPVVRHCMRGRGKAANWSYSSRAGKGVIDQLIRSTARRSIAFVRAGLVEVAMTCPIMSW